MKLNLSTSEKSTIWSFVEQYDNDNMFDSLTNSLCNVLKGIHSKIDIENIYKFWDKITNFNSLDRILFTQMEIINF